MTNLQRLAVLPERRAVNALSLRLHRTQKLKSVAKTQNRRKKKTSFTQDSATRDTEQKRSKMNSKTFYQLLNELNYEAKMD